MLFYRYLGCYWLPFFFLVLLGFFVIFWHSLDGQSFFIKKKIWVTPWRVSYKQNLPLYGWTSLWVSLFTNKIYICNVLFVFQIKYFLLSLRNFQNNFLLVLMFFTSYCCSASITTDLRLASASFTWICLPSAKRTPDPQWVCNCSWHVLEYASCTVQDGYNCLCGDRYNFNKFICLVSNWSESCINLLFYLLLILESFWSQISLDCMFRFYFNFVDHFRCLY